MFRNLRMYRISSPWPASEQELSDVLAKKPFIPCHAFSERSAGWESPGVAGGETLCRRLNGADLLQLRTQSRVLPAAAIKEALDERVADYRTRMEQDPPRGELRRLKEQTRDELLPKALVQSDRIRGCFILAEALLVLDVATVAKAEWFLDQLRICFPQLRCAPLTFRQPPGELMTRLFLGETPTDFSPGRECRMQDLMDSKSIATWKDIELDQPSIRSHVREGMKLTHLGIGFDEVVSCVMSEDAVFSKLRFVTGDAADVVDGEDPQARQDVEFVLLTGTLQRLIKRLKKLLGGYATS